MGTLSFLGVKGPEQGVKHSTPPTPRMKQVELYLFSPFEPSWPLIG